MTDRGSLRPPSAHCKTRVANVKLPSTRPYSPELVYTADGVRLTSTHTQKGTRTYRYYAPPVGTPEPQRMRVPAAESEKLVVGTIVDKLGTEEAIAGDLIGCGDLPAALASAAMFAAKLRRGDPASKRALATDLINRVIIGQEGGTIELRLNAIDKGLNPATLIIHAPVTIGRRKASLDGAACRGHDRARCTRATLV